MSCATRILSIAVAVIAVAAISSAAEPVIGIADSSGAIRINNASVPGTSTLFEGTRIETGKAASSVKLHGGSRLLLNANTKAAIYGDRLVLERGSVEVHRATGFKVRADRIEVAPAADAKISVALQGTDGVNVSSASGGAEIRNTEGVLVARLLPGTAFRLRAADRSAATSITGVLRTENGRILLTDESTQVTFELQGGQLEQWSGKRVDVSGAASGSGPVQTLSVTGVSTAVPASSGAKAAGVRSSLTSRGTPVIIGGIAVTAGVVGGMFAAGVFDNDQPTVSR